MDMGVRVVRMMVVVRRIVPIVRSHVIVFFDDDRGGPIDRPWWQRSRPTLRGILHGGNHSFTHPLAMQCNDLTHIWPALYAVFTDVINDDFVPNLVLRHADHVA